MLTVVIGIHIAAGLTAVIAGLTAMLAPKQAGRHPRSGHVFLVALGVVFATALGIVAARPHTAYLRIPGSIALLAAATGLARAPDPLARLATPPLRCHRHRLYRAADHLLRRQRA